MGYCPGEVTQESGHIRSFENSESADDRQAQPKRAFSAFPIIFVRPF